MIRFACGCLHIPFTLHNECIIILGAMIANLLTRLTIAFPNEQVAPFKVALHTTVLQRAIVRSRSHPDTINEELPDTI